MARSLLVRLSLMVAALAGLATVAVIANQAPPAGSSMATAANKFLATLTPEQKAKACFQFNDPVRKAWFFTPQQDKMKNFTRKGVRLEELNDSQKSAALDLLRTGLSAKGYEQATTIISLENVLKELEKNGAMVRNANWYFVCIFGEPSNTGTWGWRLEGHHLSVSITVSNGEIVEATPVVFASNPAEIRDGPKKGLRTLPEIEDLAKELIGSLSKDQISAAKQDKQLPEIKEGRPDAAVGEPVGIPAAKLTDAQKGTLRKLVEAYANRLPATAAKAELKRVDDAGPDKVYFAYCVEEDKKGKPYTYRVHGPTFVVEFLNVQADAAGNPANHIHSGWRRLPSDFAVK